MSPRTFFSGYTQLARNKMAAFLVKLHEVAKDFVKQTSRASSDRQTAVQITAEVLQLTRSVLRKHQHGGDAFRYHLAQPYRMLAREFVHWNRIALRRMKPKCSVRNPWLIIFTRNMPFEIFETLNGLIVAGELKTGKGTKHVESLKIADPKNFLNLILEVSNKHSSSSLQESCTLQRKSPGGGHCRNIINENNPVTIKYSKKMKTIRVSFYYGCWNRHGIPQHTLYH